MAIKKISYEDAVANLEEILEKLESRKLGLDEQIKTFNQGVELCDYLDKLLNDAEGKVAMLMEKQELEFEVEQNDTEL